MKSWRKIAYRIAVVYIFFSPLIRLGERAPSLIQRWPMYAGKRNLCTLRFSDRQGEDPNFHFETQRLLNLGLFRAANTPFILANENRAAKILRAYCNIASTRVRPFRAELQCFKGNSWSKIENFGDTECKQ